MADSELDDRCGECFSDDLSVESIRDVRRPRRRGEPRDAEPVVVARKVTLRCRRCGWTDYVIRKVAGN